MSQNGATTGTILNIMQPVPKKTQEDQIMVQNEHFAVAAGQIHRRNAHHSIASVILQFYPMSVLVMIYMASDVHGKLRNNKEGNNE
jgi:hypothetical protein